MTDLPTGTVTFLFTDIEGSTRLLQHLGDRYPSVLAEHQRLLRFAFQSAGGCEFDTQGPGHGPGPTLRAGTPCPLRGQSAASPSFCVAFSSAHDVLSAAVESQRALAAHVWPADASLRVLSNLGWVAREQGEYEAARAEGRGAPREAWSALEDAIRVALAVGESPPTGGKDA